MMDPNDHITFHKSHSAIAQLNELQIDRRLKILDAQRKKREEQFSYLQDLKKIVPHINITLDSPDDMFRKEFSKNLMKSEWMMEEPEDLEDFILVPCPKGIRSTLIFEAPEEPQEEPNPYDNRYRHEGQYGYQQGNSRGWQDRNQRGYQQDNQRGYQQGNSRGYQQDNQRGYQQGNSRGYQQGNQRGYQQGSQFGHGPQNPKKPKENPVAKLYGQTGHKLFDMKTNIPPDTILDCIYVKKNRTIYILDCMKYDGRDLTNCDVAFRRYWIGSKFFECRLGLVDIRAPNKELKLNFIEGYEFKMPHRVHHCFQRMPCFDDCAELDGYLFYHKDSSYTPGETPLVLWLFPFMVDEVLTMFRVHPVYNNCKPDDYTNYIEYIDKFNNKKVAKNEKRFKNKRKNAEPVTKLQCGTSNEMSFEDDKPSGSKGAGRKVERFDEDFIK